MKNQLTLAIESSCDDTSIAIIQNDWTNFVVKKIVAYSQISDHQKYGGVVPELAYRIHEEKIIKLIDEIWRSQINEVDTISVTAEPWLMGSLMIGLTSAYAIGKFLNKPVIEVNHIYGHIFSILLERDITKIKLPMAVLTVSGGHNEIYIINHQNKAKSDNISDIKKSKTSTAQQFYILQYEQIIKYIVDFFGGEDDKIKNFIRDEINKCIKSQNFEWAAKLRDIYNNMDKFATTKQSIYLPNPMSGQFWEIRQAGAHYIYVIVNYQIGKIVDILRFDEKMEDADYDSILAKIKLEFGEMKVKKKNGYIYGWCKELEPTEEDIKTIYGQINNFVDSHILSSVYKKDNIMWDLLATLQRRYNLTKYPYNIECLDISHLSGGRASWAISSTQWWLPYKKWYRQYKIKVAPGDDFASIKEVLIRRFDSRKTDKYNYLPDLFVIDWWLWQLNVAKKLLSEYIYIYQNVQFVALWKWTARKSSSKNFGAKETLYILDSDEQIRKIELVYDDTDRIMTKIRDEAHRFSNRYRKKQMEMEIR